EGIERGIVGRLWNLGAARDDFRLTLAGGLRTARRTSHIETELTPVSLSGATLADGLASMQMQTYLLNGLGPRATSERGGDVDARAAVAEHDAGRISGGGRARAPLTQTAGPPGSGASHWRIVGTGDFNGDGQSDLL